METNDYFCGEEWKGFLTPPRFRIVYSDEVISFLSSLGGKARVKVLFNMNKSKYVTDETLFKKLSGTDIWEFRTLYARIHYRIYAFWDAEKQTMVTTHGIIKKGRKTPQKEIVRAETIKQQYNAAKQS